MKALRTYKFKTKLSGTVVVHERTYDDAWEVFLRQGFAETDVIEVI